MPAPDRIGRYRVTGELGRGAMGTVYRAHDDGLDREVALKVMSHGIADREARARFLREAKAAARLAHPNIVVIYELGEHEGAPFMALELLEGVDLAQAISAGIRPDPRTTLPLVLQMLGGLGHAHEHGIVHRDVKPSNVFLPYGRPAKIMDFGVARLAGLGTTTSGAIVGTPNYMSPEQVGSGELDGRSDLFSVGLILYELVTGEKAIRADTVVAALYKILHEAPDFSVLPGGAGWSELQAVLERALARRREDRYATAREMADDLGRALVALGGAIDLSAATDQLLALPRRTRKASSSAAGPAARAAASRPAQKTVTPAAAGLARPVQGGKLWLWLAAGGILVAAALGVGLGLRGAVGRSSPSAARPTSPPSLDSSPTLPAKALAATPRPASAVTPGTISPTLRTTLPPTAAPAMLPEVKPGKPASPEELVARARDHLSRSRWADALAEARAVLETDPTHREASRIAQDAEAELVIEDCLGKARAALRAGDRETALEEVRRGFMVRKSDERLLAMHREALQQ